VNQSRLRVSGIVSKSDRGPILTLEGGAVWVLEYEDPIDEFVGKAVVAEGTVVSFDRLKADWIGLTTVKTD